MSLSDHDSLYKVKVAVLTPGTADDDIFSGDSSNNVFVGNADIDTAIFTGLATDYTVVNNVDGSVTVTDDRFGSPDGTDTLWGVEVLRFAQ